MDTIDLSDFFTTKPQAIDFSARLTNVMAKIYGVNFNLEKVLQEEYGMHKTDKFLALLRDNQIPSGNNFALNEFCGKLQKTITTLPVATITIAIEPTEEILKSISDWFLLNLKQQILIEIETDPDLIAGAAVNYQGKHFNASIKSVFDEICSNTLSPEKKVGETLNLAN